MRIARNIISAVVLWGLYVPAAYAQLGADTAKDIAGKANLTTETNLAVIIGNLVRALIGMLGIVFLILTVYAGFLYLTARGEEEKVKHAKETLQRSVIGLIIITSAYAIASFVINAAIVSTKGTPAT